MAAKKPIYPVIPVSVELMGNLIEVILRDDLLSEKERIGEAVLDQYKIHIQNPNTGPIAVQLAEQAYWHELVHFMLHFTGYTELCFDEKLVDLLGQLLYQASKTASYQKVT